MDILYTKHAIEQITERKIPVIWVEEAIKNPSEIMREKDKYQVTKKLNGISVEVVYVKKKYIKVITCYLIR
ncbi:MAG: DUF4258 domain-containing protein [Nanoarchaeota archaeon]